VGGARRGRAHGRGTCAAARFGGCGTGARGPLRTAWMAGEGIRREAAFSIPQTPRGACFPVARPPPPDGLDVFAAGGVGCERRDGADSPSLHGPRGPVGTARAARGPAVTQHGGRGKQVERGDRDRPDPRERRTGRERTLRRPEGRATLRSRGTCSRTDSGELSEAAAEPLLEPIWRPMGLYRPLERGLGQHADRGRPGRGPALALAARRGGPPRPDRPGGPARGLGRTPGMPLGPDGQRS